MNINQRYAKHFRTTADKASCIKQIQEIESQRSQLPREVALGFDTAYGLDAKLDSFLQSNFGLDIKLHPEKEVIISELLSGNYKEDNPVLALPDGDLIADQIAQYASISKDIREAFDIDLTVPVVMQEIFPDLDAIQRQESFFTHLFLPDGELCSQLHIQVDVCDKMHNVRNTTVLSHNSSSEIKEVNITLFDGDEPVGVLSALCICFLDIAVFGGKEHAYHTNIKMRNSTLITDINANFGQASSALIGLIEVISPINVARGLKPSTSIASELILSEDGKTKKGILHISHVDIVDDHKHMLNDILETLGVVFAEPARFNQATYAPLCLGFNHSHWDAIEEEPVIVSRRKLKEKEWKMGGISAITLNSGCQWWHEAIGDFVPDLEGEMSDAIVHIEGTSSKSIELPERDKPKFSGIIDLLTEAAVGFDSLDPLN